MSEQQRQELRAFYEAEGRSAYQTRLYDPRDWVHQRLKSVVLGQVKGRCHADTRLLDAGCAEGLYMRETQSLVQRAVGLDLSHPKLVSGVALARQHPHLHFGVADLEQIPLASASFDVALSVETVEHVPDHRAAVSELHRVLKPGGMLVISVPTEADELGGRYKMQLDWREKSGHLHSFSRDEFGQILEDAGFSVESRFTVDMLGGRVRYAIVSSLPWRAARAAWRVWATRRRRQTGASTANAADRASRSMSASSTPVSTFENEARLENQNENDIPPVTPRYWQRLDEWLTRLPGLRRWGSLGVWVCRKPEAGSTETRFFPENLVSGDARSRRRERG